MSSTTDDHADPQPDTLTEASAVGTVAPDPASAPESGPLGDPAADPVGDASPLVLVTVGTDHHPFDRVIGWVDEYVDGPGRGRGVRLVCQHGTAAPSRHGDGSAFFHHRDLHGLMQRATVVVSHGGPSTLLEVVRSGRKPIAVPRRQRHGEAVDDHQQEFCRFLEARDRVLVVDTRAELHDALDRALAEPHSLQLVGGGDDDLDAPVEVAVNRFADVVGRLRPTRRGRLLGRLRRRRRQDPAR